MTDYEQLTLFPTEQQPTQGWVYVFIMGEMRVKIGWTGRNPKTRAREMKGELLTYGPGSKADEARYHKRLAKYRLGRTEDFVMADEVMAVVSEIKHSKKYQQVNWPNVP